ncbi:MAG TPA: PHP domain-containing protein [Anaeromyxobacter sp.]|nr:PHP domain-containing protein [Anaeromyxobacter sp.]
MASGPDGVIDLHSHSRASDGQFLAAEVAEQAAAAGLRVWALCDHDTVAGLHDAQAAADRLGVRFVPGIELSAFLDRREIHLLGHFVDPDHPTLRRFEDFLADRRRVRMGEIVVKLAKLGVHVRVEDIEKYSGGKTIGRPHVARAIMETGTVSSVKEAFDRYLGEGRPAYVQRYRLEADEAVQLVRSAGGTTTVAHPGVSSSRGATSPGSGRPASTGSRSTTRITCRRSARSTCGSRRSSTSCRRPARISTGRRSRRTGTSGTSR